MAVNRELMFGQMVESIQENGSRIICMAKDFTHGRMVAHMKVNILTTKNMDLDNIFGKMEDNI